MKTLTRLRGGLDGFGVEIGVLERSLKLSASLSSEEAEQYVQLLFEDFGILGFYA